MLKASRQKGEELSTKLGNKTVNIFIVFVEKTPRGCHQRDSDFKC